MDNNGEERNKTHVNMSIKGKIIKTVTSSDKTKKVMGYVFLGGVAALGIWGIVHLVKNASAELSAKKKAKNDRSDATDYVEGRKLTDEQAKEVAEKLFDAMDGVGTNLLTIKKLLIEDDPSPKDVIAIHKAFGIRDYGTFGSPWIGSGDKLDLRGWINREVSSLTTIYMLLSQKFKDAGLPLESVTN